MGKVEARKGMRRINIKRGKLGRKARLERI
jgi:hypothetical protein